MTAAVSSSAHVLEPQADPAFVATAETSRPTHRVPYLTAVPDCEPPFDDDPRAEAHRESARPAFTRQPTQSTGDSHRLTTEVIPVQQAGRPLTLPTARPGRTNVRTKARVSTSPSARVTADPATAEPTSAAPAGSDRWASTAVGPTTIASHGVPKWSSEADVGVRLTTSSNLPPAKRSASVLARALVEVLSGRRPVAQLRVHCAPEIYAGLLERGTPGPMSLPHLLTVHVCEPADGVAEVSAAFKRADRVRALAFRIQGVDGRWRITALQLG
jgi:hypothetical protein